MIKFPKMSVAASVVNRILNVADEINRKKAIKTKPAPAQAPVVPDAQPEGDVLNQKLSLPTPDMPPLGDPQGGAATSAVLQGGTPLQGLVAPK